LEVAIADAAALSNWAGIDTPGIELMSWAQAAYGRFAASAFLPLADCAAFMYGHM
jgi:hypothetical protein